MHEKSCPLNDPETMLNPATAGMSCTCQDPTGIQRDKETGVWKVNEHESAARRIASLALKALGIDPERYWRTRDRVVCDISTELQDMLDSASGTKVD